MRLVSCILVAVAMLPQSAIADPELPPAPDEVAETIVLDKPPVPTYPTRAIRKQIQGLCVLMFDVSAEGRTENIRPACSHEVFCKESKRAISKVTLPPTLNEAGDPVARKDLTYPLEYRLAGVAPDPDDWSEPKACFSQN